MLCAKEKVPEYSLNSEGHDSWRAFRSQNVNVRLNLETKPARISVVGQDHLKPQALDRARLEMYSSTIRWLESLKWLFSGASRPIRKGRIFTNFQNCPKQSFFRHFRKIRCSFQLHQLQIDYWTSASKMKGVLVNVAQGLQMSSEYSLKLSRHQDGLIHRPRSEWSTEYTNCQMGTSDIWFQSMTYAEGIDQQTKADDSAADTRQQVSTSSGQRQIEKSFFFSVEEVKYNRDIHCFPQQALHRSHSTQSSGNDNSPSHILIVNGAKGAWTESNRDMAYALYDSWRRAHVLRGQVSGEGLKLLILPLPEGQTSSEITQSLQLPYLEQTRSSLPSKTATILKSSSHSGKDENEGGELRLSSLGKEWKQNSLQNSVEKMIELAGKGGGGGDSEGRLGHLGRGN